MTNNDRASCWSITINNPEEGEVKCEHPGWTLTGQFEEGAEGTRHFQGMLKTPQVRFSAVKRVFPRAHIEVARNKQALEAYVHKSETRVAEYAGSSVPNMFQFQDTIAGDWVEADFKLRLGNEQHAKRHKHDIDDIALAYVDELVATRIERGGRGLEFIAINPMWRSSWKKFWRNIITRNARPPPPQPEEAPSPSPAPQSPADAGNSGEGPDL